MSMDDGPCPIFPSVCASDSRRCEAAANLALNIVWRACASVWARVLGLAQPRHLFLERLDPGDGLRQAGRRPSAPPSPACGLSPDIADTRLDRWTSRRAARELAQMRPPRPRGHCMV